MTPSPFKRSGLHRLECGCENYTYSTVAALEQHGLPVCPCGERFMPARVELSMLLGLDDCPLIAAYQARVFGFQRGQHASYARKGHDGTRSAYDAVVDEFARDYTRQARARRLTGLKLHALPVSNDPMPF